jgi:uncharacterized protein (DUF305 family)
MKRIMFSLCAIVLFAGTALASADEAVPEACSGGDMGHMMGQQMPGMAAGMTDMQKAYMEGMQRMDAAMMPGMMADDPDVAFICGMRAHHQGAIDMARVELKYGKDGWAKELAQKIIDAQTKEIADMDTWLAGHAK